jgi:hypothetical protein
MAARRLPALWLNWRASRIADPVRRLRYLRAATARPVRPRRPIPIRLLAAPALFLVPLLLSPVRGPRPEPPMLPAVMAGPEAAPVEAVWLVESGRGYEVYSNGLRIEAVATVFHGVRNYVAISRGDFSVRERHSTPVGIVYHTNESHMAPFAADQNSRLQRVGKWLLDYVRENRSYHYLIDRFGRVHRIVAEDSPAAHAGTSIWADAEWAYANLNHAFLGVSFELETARGDAPPETLNPAQIRAARTLTEMLRARYSIAAGNCVTHAQVSVNPSLRRIGLHTDWSANFPYTAVGLPENYELPLPSITLCGFTWDNAYLAATGPRLWKSLVFSEELLRQQAALSGLPVAEYRAARQRSWAALFPARPAGS